jgi:predicted thioredoxin/glutaredoxin
MGEWIVYSRENCGLCESFMAELAEQLGSLAAGVKVVDIDGDAELKRRYFDRVPVLTVDGDFVCAIKVDPDRIRRHLGA